jgi:hypothetical protein
MRMKDDPFGVKYSETIAGNLSRAGLASGLHLVSAYQRCSLGFDKADVPAAFEPRNLYF